MWRYFDPLEYILQIINEFEFKWKPSKVFFSKWETIVAYLLIIIDGEVAFLFFIISYKKVIDYRLIVNK